MAALEAELEALDDAALRSKVAELRAKFEALPLSSEPSEARAQRLKPPGSIENSTFGVFEIG